MIVDCGVYRGGKRTASPPDVASAVEQLGRDEDAFCWMGLYEPDADELGRVAEAFDLHPLAVEDALEAHQRPKLEVYDDMLFVVLKTLWYMEDSSSVGTGEINIFVGPAYVVTVRHGPGLELKETRADLERRASVLGHGPASVLYAICDHVVDEYGDVANELEIDVDGVEASVFSAERTSDAQTVYALKREVLRFRRAVAPLGEPMHRLAAGAVPGVEQETRHFFRDVADHVTRVGEQIESLDDLLSSVLSAHLARVGVQQNEDMRRISAWVAIVAVPTAIAGIYGMNFENMPELDWTFGYPGALALMAVCCTVLYRLFKRAGWL